MIRLAVLASLAVFLGGAPTSGGAGETAPPAEAYSWRLPPGFPEPPVPADDPMSAAKVELGRHLFYEPGLSRDGSYACASCHRQQRAFTDGRARALGVTGELHPRGAMSLANVAYAPSLGWDDPDLDRLEEQALVPLLGEHPVELGLRGHEDEALERLRQDPLYRQLFAAAFPAAADPFTLDHVTRVLAAFERTLISGDSPFDRWLYRSEPLPEDARRGMRLFFSERLACSRCHRGFTFAGDGSFHNTGLHDLDGQGAYPEGATGHHRHTGRAEDMGRFRVPTLRNVALTAPYMHDGSLATLGEVIDHYARGGRAASPLTSPLLAGFALDAEEKADLLAFLHSLTDRGFVEDPRFASPFDER